MSKTYLLKGRLNQYKIPKCPKCKIDWGVKLYYEDNPGDVKFEYNNFTIDTKINEADKKYYKEIKCLGCDYTLNEEHYFMSEKQVIDFIEKDK